ncbi:MAG: hypothetical protein ABIR46_02075, partial [Candidatus Saccharimonadales bacterium]
DQPLPGMENLERTEYFMSRVDPSELIGPELTDKQFTAIFYEGGEAAERAKAEIDLEFKKLRDNNNG